MPLYRVDTYNSCCCKTIQTKHLLKYKTIKKCGELNDNNIHIYGEFILKKTNKEMLRVLGRVVYVDVK